MSFSTWANASPKSFESRNAWPPVSDASVVSVSCCAFSVPNCCPTAWPENAPSPPRLPCQAFLDSNDFGEAFAQVEKDISSYYIIGYASTNTNQDGRYRRI